MKPRGRVLAASLVLPMGLLVMDPGGLSPYGPAKWWAVSSVAGVAAALCLWGSGVRVLPAAALAWAALLVMLCMGAVTGADGLYGWTGTPERNFGVLTWILCALCFLAGHRLEDPDDARRVVAAGVVGAGVVGLWATAEALGWNPVRIATDPDRLVGPLGSAAFLGAAAALLLPMCAACSFDRSWSARSRAVAAASAGLCAVGLVGAGARAAWFGAAAAALAVVTLHRREVLARGRLVLPAVAAGVVGLLAAGALLGVSGRLVGGGSSRLDEWRVAARVLARHPFGVGPEGYRIAFAEGVDPSYERRHGRAFLPDRAHNLFLDVSLAAGVPGMAIYLVLLGVVAGRLVRALRRGPVWVAGVSAGLVAYWAQELFLFPVATLEPAVWLLAGVVVAQVARPDELRDLRGRPVGIAAAGALAAVAFVAGALDLLADRQAKAALVALDGGRISRAEQHARRAVSLRPDVLRYRLAAERAHAASGTVEGDADALEELDAALALSPRDPVVRSEKAEFLLARAQRTLRPADISRAEAYLTRLVAEDPVNAELQLRMGVASALAGDDAGAEGAWKAAESLAPRSASASTNLAELYARQGRWPDVDVAARQALQRDPTSEAARRLLAESAKHGT